MQNLLLEAFLLLLFAMMRSLIFSFKYPFMEGRLVHTFAAHCPMDSTPLLHIRNPHVYDARIEFYENDHRYTFDGRRMKWSVTSLIQRYFHQFDAAHAANKMISGKQWPRKEYCHPCGRPFTAEEVMQVWSTIGEQARLQGSKLHQNIDRICNGLDPPHKEMQEELHQFQEFYRNFSHKEHISPFRTEWRIAAPDFSIAGSVDFVGINPQEETFIVDWKRTKKMSPGYESGFGPRFAKPPLQHIPDSELSKYMLQLNMYDFILERYYKVRSKQMLLVSLHPSLKKPFVYKVPKLRREIELIVEDSQKELN